MATAPAASLGQHFADLSDPRDEAACRHELLDIIGITLCAVIAGAEPRTAVEAYGRAEQAWLAQSFRLPHGIPSHDTSRGPFCLLDPQASRRGFAPRIAASADAGVGSRPTIPIDGKAPRRSGRRGAGLAPLHLVSARAAADHVSSGQGAVDAESDEITAIPRLLELLDLSGAPVTIGAMGGQKEIAARIVAGGGDYISAVRANQPRLYQGIEDCFTAALGNDSVGVSSCGMRAEEINQGREEVRECQVITQPTGLRDAASWTGWTAICMVSCHRVVDGVASEEIRYYIGSSRGTAEEYRRAIRGHWGIEDSLHWALEVVSRGDESRHHAGDSGEDLASLRKFAISLLKQDHTSEDSLKTKRLRCGWDNAYLEKVLTAPILEDA